MVAAKVRTAMDDLEVLRTIIGSIKRHVELENNLTSQWFTDFAARLNALAKDLTEVKDEVTGSIKVELIKDQRTIAEGQHYLAVMVQADVVRLDTDRVKQFLGRRLSDYQITNREYRLSFKPKG